MGKIKSKKVMDPTKLKNNNGEVVKPDYSVAEQEYYDSVKDFVVESALQKEQQHAEFNDRTFTERYSDNRLVGFGFVEPTYNLEDKEVSSGTTHQKIIALLSSLKAFNFNADITAYDQDDLPQEELAKQMEELVTKTKNVEKDNIKKTLRWMEMLQQGDVFVQEMFVEDIYPEKKMETKFDGKISSAKWKTTWKKKIGVGKTRVISGLNVFPANNFIYSMDEQPAIYYTDCFPYEVAKMIFGNWERWKFVPTTYTPFVQEARYQNSDTSESYVGVEGYCEIGYYENKAQNEYNIYVNGVQMMPAKYPLQEVSPTGEFTLSRGGLKPFHPFFFWSKAVPDDSKFLEEIYNELMRLLILITEQYAKPTIIDNSNKSVSRKLFVPATIIKNVDPEKIKPFNTNLGVTPSQYSLLNLIKGEIDANTVNPIIAGDTQKGEQTATELELQTQQSKIKMGVMLDGVMELERELTWKRIFTILDKYTDEISGDLERVKSGVKNNYRRITLNMRGDKGEKKTRILEFNPEKAGQSPEETKVEARNIATGMGRENIESVELVYLNPDLYKKALEYVWDVNIVAEPVYTTDLKRLLFDRMIDRIVKMAPNKLNLDYALERSIILGNEDPNKLLNEGESQPEMTEINPAEMGGEERMNNQVEKRLMNQINAPQA